MTTTHRPGRRPAVTLVEMLVVLSLIGLVATFVLPSLKRGYDRIQTRAAARETMMAFFAARMSAVAAGRRVAVVLDERAARIANVADGETLLVRRLGDVHGVRVSATRDSMAYYPNGLALGGANLSVVLARGSAADTVIVSREGRVKMGARAR